MTAPIATQYRATLAGRTVTFGTAAAKFAALADEWDAANAGRSRVDFNVAAYHQVIGMGEVVVPFLLDRLRDGDGDWIYAIKCITGEQADTPDMWGDPDRVIAAWLAWGSAREAADAGL